jgi:hypothetical protein
LEDTLGCEKAISEENDEESDLSDAPIFSLPNMYDDDSDSLDDEELDRSAEEA